MSSLDPPLTPDIVESLLKRINPGAQLESCILLKGSFSNEASRINFKTALDEGGNLVLRRYAIFGDYDRGEKARREFKTLQLLNHHNIPAPAPLLLDAKGDILGSPGIVTDFVPGRQVIIPDNKTVWIQELACTLARIHALPITEQEIEFLLDSNREVVWFLNGGQVTEDMAAYPGGPAVWQTVNDLYPVIQPATPALGHIDYWLGNMLWQDGRITAVLDWEEAAYGDPGYDVAYRRIECALLGGEVLADLFLEAYIAEAGQPVENLAFWELAAAARFMPKPEDMITEWQTFDQGKWSAGSVRQNFSDFITSSKRRLGL